MVRTLRLALAGLRYRRSRSGVVAALVVLATAAAVLGPGYARAAEQSVLRDHLRAAPTWLTGFTVSAAGTAGDENPAGATGMAGAQRVSSDALARIPVSYLASHVARSMLADRYFQRPVGGVQTSVRLPDQQGDPTTGRLVYRQGYCARLRIVQGRCPARTGEVLASSRSLLRSGTKLVVHGVEGSTGTAPPGHTAVTIVGRYAAPATDSGYWFRHGYFDGAVVTRNGQELRKEDSYFGSEATVRSLGANDYLTFADFALRTGQIDLVDLPDLTARMSAGQRALERAGLTLYAPLRGVLADVRAERRQVSLVSLLVAVQLVLLCWFVLFGVVRGATEERGPELGLAKLRGLSTGQVAGFGLAEIGLLALIATPPGVLVGLAVTEVIARVGLAAGVHAELRPLVLLAAVLAFGGAMVAAGLAVRRTVVTPVIDLLRRVPVRSGRLRAGVTDGVLVAVAGVACYELLTGAGGRLGLLAGGLVAVLAGLLAGRLAPLLLRGAVRRARRRGRIPALLAAARLSRRGSVPRTLALLTVAVALLCFGTVTWDVAGRNTHQRAGVALGAGTVYQVTGVSAAGLTSAVRRADPSGRQAMAVARGLYGSGADTTELLAVDSTRLARVAFWPQTKDADRPAALAARIRSAAPQPVLLRESVLTLSVMVGEVSRDMALVALLSDDSRRERVARFGVLHPGRHRLNASLTGCPHGCRLVGFDLYRGPRAPERITGSLTLTGLLAAGRPVGVNFSARTEWRGVDATLDQPVSEAAPGPGGTVVRFDSGGGEDLRVFRSDAPYPVPAVTTGRAERDGTVFRGPGLYGLDQAYRSVGRARTLPAIGNGMLVDLAYADRAAPVGDALDTPLRYQVWAVPGAPAGLRDRLAAAGVTVTGTDTLAARDDRSARQGPALALRLYLIAAVLALLMAAGTVLVTEYLSAQPVAHELAALRTAGVSPGLLRRAGLREYALLLGAALLSGVLAGGVSAALALPHLPQIADPAGGPAPLWWPDPWWPGGAVLASAVLLGLVAAVVVAAGLRRSGPRRLREGSV